MIVKGCLEGPVIGGLAADAPQLGRRGDPLAPALDAIERVAQMISPGAAPPRQ